MTDDRSEGVTLVDFQKVLHDALVSGGAVPMKDAGKRLILDAVALVARRLWPLRRLEARFEPDSDDPAIALAQRAHRKLHRIAQPIQLVDLDVEEAVARGDVAPPIKIDVRVEL
jgi:hypothetical protein